MPRKRTLDDESTDASSSKRRNTSQRIQSNNSCSQDKSSECLQLSQNLSSSFNNIRDPSIRSGKILRIRLVNFMCHENLVVNFNNRINLLIGNNGSGKSAILTALVVGLGSTAKSTNRSKSIKQLVKNGENSGSVEIEIANNGWDAYNKENFGEKITIVRTINVNGSSQYKIKNEIGQIIYKNNEKLQKILLYFNIQADNPVFVLNQDNARSFLRDLDPAKNYTFFLKATQIETILEKLNECVHMFMDYKYRLDCYKKQTELAEKEVLELQKKYDRLRSADELKISLKTYNLEKLWLKVINQENVIKNIEKQIANIMKEKMKFENLINNKESIENQYKEQFREIEEQLRNFNESFNTENQELQAIKSELDKVNEQFQIEQRYTRKLNDKVAYYEQQINLLKDSISERATSSNSRLQKIREENEKRISEQQKQIKDLQAMLMNTKRDIELVTNTKNQYEEQFEDFKRRRQQTIVASENLQREMKSVQATKKDTLSMYGEHTGKLIASIEREYRKGRFSQMPKGPVGRYIEVADQKWRSVIEYLLLGCINLFLVNSPNDRKVLDEILKREFPGVKQRIVTNQFHHEVYNVQKGMVQPPQGSRLLMNEIKCSDPVVMNCLIDRAHIETILLVDNQDLAVKLTSDADNIPRNLQRVILLNPLMEYYPLPLFRAYSLEARQSRYLQVNIDQITKQIELEIRKNQQQQQQYEQQLKELKDKLFDIYKREKQMQIKLDQHERSKNNANAILEELQSVEYPHEDEISILQNELNELEGRLETAKRCFNDKQNLCEQHNKDKENKEKKYCELKSTLDALEKEIRKLKETHENLKLELNSKLSYIEQWKSENKRLLTELQVLKKNYQDEVTHLKLLQQNAEAEGERVETEKTEKELNDLTKSLEKKINLICSTHENVDDIKALLDDKSGKLNENRTIIKALVEVMQSLTSARMKRFKFVKTLKEHMSLRIKYYFDSLLKLRRYTGEITIDHTKRHLTVSVIPRDYDKQNAVSSTKSLSGGERSFTTVAFLLSLWTCVDHPFYFLDEYDVFTDQINRQTITQLLLHEAEKKQRCQYTFLTPQDMSFVKPSDIIKIHRLPDPKR